jgi:hypothetical protein
MMHRLLVVMLALGLARGAHADDSPWAAGVPQETQDRANALFAEGNQLFAGQAHAPALEKYQQAIALWDHPMIRFNIAVTLIRLDRVVEAADNLERALRFGAAPFSGDLYRQALDYQLLVKGRVGELEVTCDQKGAHVQLDGKSWFDCPGTRKERVLAGAHAVVGERAGDLTSAQRVAVSGGTIARVRVELVPLDRAVVLRYPIERWLPWTVGAVGVAVAGTGLAVWLSGKSQLDQFYNDLSAMCPNGCSLADQRPLANERNGAIAKGNVGVGLMIGGGITTAIGAALVIANRPERIVPKVELVPTSGGVAALYSGTF